MIAANHSEQFVNATLGSQRHICAFFNSPDEEHRVLRSFIKDGLDKGDKALHIVDPELRQDHLRHLTDAGIDVQRVSASGQLEVRSWQDTYLRGDRFDQDAMLALIEEVLQTGHTQGYSLTRLLANMEWALVDKQGVEGLLEYETRINYLLPKYDDPVICAYDLQKFPSALIMDVLRTHPLVILGGLLQENPFFVPPDQFLLELREKRTLFDQRVA
jgi:hypothetical protein